MAGRFGSALQSSAAINFIKLILTIFNFIFLASGVAILGLGIWMHVELFRYIQLTTVYYESAPYVLIGIGSGIVIIASFGCMCTIKGHGRLLYLFSAILMMVFVVELATAIAAFAYRSTIEEGFSRGLSKAIEEYDTDSEKREAIDGIQKRLKCCGNDSYMDWLGKEESKVPQSCCKVKNCDTANKEEIYAEGCYLKVSSFMRSNFTMIGSIAIGFAFLQLLGALLSCCLGKNINKAKYEQVD